MSPRASLPTLGSPLADVARQAIVGRVRSLFNAEGQQPVVRSPDALFPPDSVTWRVHGDVTAMMVGGMAALLLQMLHPAVLAGVWDHSSFRYDMLGRLRRTARFIALTTYGERGKAEAALAHVRHIHERVRGTLADGRPYAATDPALLSWVHLTETTSFLAGWRRYADPAMPARDQDRYFAEMSRIAHAMGAAPIPNSRREAERLIQEMRPHLACDARTREIARQVLRQSATNQGWTPLRGLLGEAAVDLLPGWARRLHGLSRPTVTLPLVRAGTLGLAGTLRWAFR